MLDAEHGKGESGGAAYFRLEGARELRGVEGVDDVDDVDGVDGGGEEDAVAMQVGSMTEGGGEVGVSTVIQGARELGTIDGNHLLNTLGVFPADLPPRRLSQVVAKGNVSRLRTIVRLVHGKEMKDVPIATLSAKLWSEYQHLRLASPALPTFTTH